MAKIADAALKQVVADSLNVAPERLDLRWDRIIAKANDDAWQEIRRRLAQRGFTPAQIDGWDDSEQFNRQIGLYLALSAGGVANTFPEGILRTYDRRKELDAVTVAVGGVMVTPGDTVNDQVGYGDLSNDSDVFARDTQF